MVTTLTPRTPGSRPVPPPAVNIRSPWHIPEREPVDRIPLDQIKLTSHSVAAASVPPASRNWTPVLVVGSMVAASLVPGVITLAAPPPPASVAVNAPKPVDAHPTTTLEASEAALQTAKGKPGTPGQGLGGTTTAPQIQAPPQLKPGSTATQPQTQGQVPPLKTGTPAQASAQAPAAPVQPVVIPELPPRMVYGPDVAAVPSVDAAVPRDAGSTWKAETTPAWRTFGHRAEGNHWFEGGKWRDTQTAVTADQAASMSPAQQAVLANSASVPVSALQLGDPARVEVEAAVGAIDKADRLDYGRSLKAANAPASATAQPVNFGHRAVRGRLFDGATWADSKTLVSADQVAVMPSMQRTVLARAAGVPVESLRVGDANRATVDEAALLAAHRFDELAAHFPDRFVTSHGFRMRADTAASFQKLLKLVGKSYPGRGIRITSTVGGHHLDPRHRDGRAIDFVVEPLTIKESKHLEELAQQAGFDTLNEYIHSSPYKTGPHMHIALD